MRHAVAEPSSGAAPISGSDWPTSVQEVQAGIGDDRIRYKQRSRTTTTLYFPREVEAPLSVTFADGLGIVHCIKVDKDPVRLVVPLEPHVFRSLGNFQKVLEWQRTVGTKEWEKSMLDPRSSLAECCFSYQPAARMKPHGISIEVTPFGLKAGEAEERREVTRLEQAFWRRRGEEVQARSRLQEETSLAAAQVTFVEEDARPRPWGINRKDVKRNSYGLLCGCCVKEGGPVGEEFEYKQDGGRHLEYSL